MLEICGYNFTMDENCLDYSPTFVSPLTSLELKNGIYDHMNVTRDTTSPYSDIPPLVWQYLTIMNANFNGNINAGNVDFVLNEISSLKVKRRVKGTFDWITLKNIPVSKIEDLIFTMVDYINANNTQYEYAFVPVLNSIEGNYIINEVFSQFNGVFICDAESIHKFYAGVKYGPSEQVQKVGVFEPFGRQYPIVVSNALTNYQKGSVSGTILPPDFMEDRKLDRELMVEQRKELLTFLTKKKAKVIKDWNGNIWLMFVIGNPSISYDNNWGQGIADVGFDYTEIGDYYSGTDLYDSGLIEGDT